LMEGGRWGGGGEVGGVDVGDSDAVRRQAERLADALEVDRVRGAIGRVEHEQTIAVGHSQRGPVIHGAVADGHRVAVAVPDVAGEVHTRVPLGLYRGQELPLWRAVSRADVV